LFKVMRGLVVIYLICTSESPSSATVRQCGGWKKWATNNTLPGCPALSKAAPGRRVKYSSESRDASGFLRRLAQGDEGVDCRRQDPSPL